MGQSLHYRPADFTDEEVEALRAQLMEAASRMTGAQVLMLADDLHDLIRRRRGSRTFQRAQSARLDRRH